MPKYFISLTILAALAVSLLGGNGASAASDYDLNYHTTDTLNPSSTNSSTGLPDDIDISQNLSELFSNQGLTPEFMGSSLTYANYSGGLSVCTPNQPCGRLADILSLWNDNKLSWTISDAAIAASNGAFQGEVTFCFSTDSPLVITWLSTSVATGAPYCFAVSYFPDDDDYYLYSLPAGFGAVISAYNPNPIGNVYNYYSNIPSSNFNYPSGYDGAPIRTQAPSLTVNPHRDATPKFIINRLVNHELTFVDSNFATTNFNYPFLCEPDGLAPVVHWVLSYTDTNAILEEHTNSAVAIYDLTLPDTGFPEEYRIEGSYSCDGQFNDFTKTSYITFKTDINGNLYYNFFTGCFTETFPFIDFQGCMDNFQTVLAMMGFNIDNPLDVLSPVPADCRTLSVVHNWLGLNNNIVCRQFPLEVRQVVTPFVSFALGLMALRFIASRRRDDL